MDDQSRKWLLERVALYAAQSGNKVSQFGLSVLGADGSADFAEIYDGFLGVGVWALQNAATVLKAIKQKQPFTVLVGMRPSRRYHVGHLTMMRELHWLIEQGGKPFFIIAGYEAGKFLSQADLDECMLAFADCYGRFTGSKLPDLGSSLVLDRQDTQLNAFESLVSENVSLSTAKRIYGWDDTASLAKLRVASMTAAAFLYPQILFPQQPTLVLSDINQVTHAEMTRHAAKQLKMRFPAVSYRMLMPSLLGPGKRMSVKVPASLIELHESPDAAAIKLKRSFSGGRLTVEQQSREGGEPFKCSFFAMLAVLDPESASSVYRSCTEGAVLCGQCKKSAFPRIVKGFNSSDQATVSEPTARS